jgi:hypothetical protein
VQVFAIDLVGFGYSQKARLDYTNAEVGRAGLAATQAL